jgi:hypothetical protein
MNDKRVEVITDINKIRTYVPEYAFVLFHNLHFFIYCYFIILYFKLQYGINNHLLGLFYLIGWIGYFFIYYFPPKSKMHALFGHLLCFVSIIAIPYSTNIILTLF